MKRGFSIRHAAACTGILALILDSRTALTGAQSGIDLIIRTVIPSLFPFFFLSVLLTESGEIGSFSAMRPLYAMFRIPPEYGYLLIPAFLGGYPAGAQSVGMAWKRRLLTKETAERLLGYCCNAGPSFFFGILAVYFPEWWMCWSLWGLHILGAIAAAWVIPSGQFPCASKQSSSPEKSVPEVLLTALGIMANVSGWLLLFRVLIAFLERWFFWRFPISVRVFLSGFLELANGCSILDLILDIRLRFVLCSVMMSMGGLCVFLQTKSVSEGLSLQWYVLGKFIQASVSGLTAAACLYKSVVPLYLLLFLLPFLAKQKKRGSIRAVADV